MPKYMKYFISIMVFVLGLAAGSYLGLNKNMKQEESEKTQIVPVQDVVIRKVQNKEEPSGSQVVETVVEETKLSPYAKMIIEKKFNRCGHTTVEVQELPIELVNMTEVDILQKYPDWEIKKFDSNEISLYREIEANCNDHFVIKEKDGFLAIYTNVTEDVQNLKEVTDIDISHLPSGDAESIRDGIYVYGKDALAGLIEDFSS